jgi:hypothetical protein
MFILREPHGAGGETVGVHEVPEDHYYGYWAQRGWNGWRLATPEEVDAYQAKKEKKTE